jgi:hypothetical protein
MKTQTKKSELSVMEHSLAPQHIVSRRIIASQALAMVGTGVLSPGFEKVKRRMQAREKRRIDRHQRLVEWQRKQAIKREQRRTPLEID